MSKDNTNFFKAKNDWSKIKDKLLGCYLTPYFQKVLVTGKPICYIDCFAGKGKFEDGNAGSPLIALQIREDCLGRTTRSNKRGAIQTWFIDMNHAAELTKNINSMSPSYDRPNIISGKYEENICYIDAEPYWCIFKGKQVFFSVGNKHYTCKLQ